MRVAICDDNNFDRAELAMLIWPFQDEYETMTLKEFSCGEDLLSSINDGQSFDFLFIDIEMPGILGTEVAKKIRETDSSAIIFFVTVHDQFFMDAFCVKAYQYFVKPIDAKRFNRDFRRAIKEFKKRRFTYAVESKERTSILHIKDIVYLESTGRNITIHTEFNEHNVLGSLDHEESVLRHYNFVRSHRSFLINMTAITDITSDSVHLVCGHKVPLSRRRKNEVAAAFSRFIVNER